MFSTNHNDNMEPVILGIDPGTKEMGLAVLRGRDLLGYGVHTLRNGEQPHDVIGQAKRIVLGYIAKYAPEIVAIERPLPIPTKRAALLSVIAQELECRTRELDLVVRQLGPAEVREILVGNPQATKLDVARAILELGFEELRPLQPKRPARAALGLRPRERYWLHVFDALALAIAAEAAEGHAAGHAPPSRLLGGKQVSGLSGPYWRRAPSRSAARSGTTPRIAFLIAWLYSIATVIATTAGTKDTSSIRPPRDRMKMAMGVIRAFPQAASSPMR